MKELRYTLLTDGSSDRAFLPLLTWLLCAHGVQMAVQAEWADLRRVPQRPGIRRTFADRIKLSIELYPCDLLFIHRDAEREPRQARVEEIDAAVNDAARMMGMPPTICVIPVRMQEAWRLFDEAALRMAAGNPHGRQALALPRLREVEHLPDPKGLLHELIREASGLHGRRRKKLAVSTSARRIAEFIDDFSPLRALPAFAALEADVLWVIGKHGWSGAP